MNFKFSNYVVNLKSYVTWESFLFFRKLISEVLMFQGTLELVGNFLNPIRTVLDGRKLIGNFYPLKSGTWGLIFAHFVHWELPRIHDRHVRC